MDGMQSRVFDQAENRMHAQKALLYLLNQVSSPGEFRSVAVLCKPFVTLKPSNLPLIEV